MRGKIRRVKVALDTQSNVSFTKEDLGTRRKWDMGETKLVKGIGGYSSKGTPLSIKIIKRVGS